MPGPASSSLQWSAAPSCLTWKRSLDWTAGPQNHSRTLWAFDLEKSRGFAETCGPSAHLLCTMVPMRWNPPKVFVTKTCGLSNLCSPDASKAARDVSVSHATSAQAAGWLPLPTSVLQRRPREAQAPGRPCGVSVPECRHAIISWVVCGPGPVPGPMPASLAQGQEPPPDMNLKLLPYI